MQKATSGAEWTFPLAVGAPPRPLSSVAGRGSSGFSIGILSNLQTISVPISRFGSSSRLWSNCPGEPGGPHISKGLHMNSIPGRPTWLDRLGWPLPPMESGDRKALVERVEAGAVGGVDFLVMMVMSAGLASLGLLEDSTAVVIGAMLVAPLMGPLIGAGLALDQADLSLFRKSVWVAILGLLMGLLVSLVIGLLNPGFEPSLEIEARGNPDLLDLGIASLSGFVAAYAFGRPGVASSLAGVAIAAALVPPLEYRYHLYQT